MTPEPSSKEAAANLSHPALEKNVPREKTNRDFEPAAWRPVVLAVVVIATFLLGSGSATWSLGTVSCLAGLAIICAPPLLRLPLVPSVSLMVFGLVPLVGLLPASWTGAEAEWRDMLWQSWGIAVSPTLSPDPRATFESWLVVVAGVAWLWTCLGQRPSDTGIRLCVNILAIGGAVVAAATLVDYYHTAIPWWPRRGVGFGSAFGPFTNRNHTSSLNAISCILCAASAYEAYRRRSHLGWLFALLFWVPLVAVFTNTSRGGLLLFFFGLVSWVTTAAMKKGILRKVVVGAALLIMAASIASVSSGRLGTRLRALMLEDKVSPLTPGVRVDLARETLALVAERPWLGHGFDTFDSLFPMLSDMKVPDMRFLHPESDLLLLLFEGGLLAVVPCLVLLVWIARSTGPWRRSGSSDKSADRPARRLRQAAAIGAAMALLHSIFDQPNHGVGYAMHTALLLGLAIRPRRLKVLSTGLQTGAFRLAGLGVLSLGIMWLGTGLQRWTPDLPTSVLILRDRVFRETQQGRYRESLPMVDRAIWLAPLDYRLYYLRAQLLLHLRQRPERALQDFGRSRALEPNYAWSCYDEGEYWLGFAPEMAIIPWRECLRRHVPDSEQLNSTYGRILSTTGPHPELRRPLWAMAANPAMQLTFLHHTQGAAEWQEYLAKFIEAHPRLESLEPQILRSLLKTWHQRGDRAELVKLLEANPRLQPYGWRTMAMELAAAGRYEEALLLAAKFIKRPARNSVAGADVARLERAFILNPTDVRPGVDLFYAQRAAGDLKAAKGTAEKVTALPNAPEYMKLELAFLYASLKEHRRAWEMMEQAMQSISDA